MCYTDKPYLCSVKQKTRPRERLKNIRFFMVLG